MQARTTYAKTPVPGKSDIPRRSTAYKYDLQAVQRDTDDAIDVVVTHSHQEEKKRRPHGLVVVLCGMLATLAFMIVWNMVATWWNTLQDDWHYGRPRTYQTDQRVGHDDTQTPSHFIAENLNGHILVIEIQGGDVSRSKIYDGPTLGDNQSLVPVTLQFRDVNGDGKLDMLVDIQGNDSGDFH